MRIFIHRSSTLGAGAPPLIGWIAALALLVILGAPAAARAQDHAGQYEQADIEFGARIYGANCVRCHAEAGDAVAGVDLRGGNYSRAASDQELMFLLRRGIPGTRSSPASSRISAPCATSTSATSPWAPRTTSRELTGLAALRDVQRHPRAPVSAPCHRVNGQGRRTAPDLSEIGAVRTAADLQRSLLDPTGSMIAVNRPVRAVLSDGTVLDGRRLNEDTYTIQLIDQNERLRSLDKADLRELSAVTTSPMPAASDLLDDQEVADVLAYLLSLKGLE